MVTGHSHADAIKPYTVDLFSKHVVTLGGDPSPSPSHLPHPTAPRLCLAVLYELVGHINEAHDVAHMLGNQLITLVPGGHKFDVQISKQYGYMPLYAVVSCSLDVCQHCQIGRWGVTLHSIITLASRHRHEGENVWSAPPPFLNLIEFVRFPKEGDSPLSDAVALDAKTL